MSVSAVTRSATTRWRTGVASVVGAALVGTALVGAAVAEPARGADVPVPGAPSTSADAAVAPVATTVDVWKHNGILTMARRVADYYGPTVPFASGVRNGWSWATYMDGDVHLYRTAGDQERLETAVTWGASTSWTIPYGQQQNPDSIKAGQVYADLAVLDPRPSLAAMDARMSADLTGMPVTQYWWIDALYMGLPTWARWAQRTGDDAYLDMMDALYASTRDHGLTTVVPCAGRAPGLYDPVEHLWYRDCRYVGERDAAGRKVFWGRGNGWVIAAMAQVLATLPPADPRGAQYREMLVGMAERLRTLQGSDGMWRSSRLSPELFPAPETSGTALITYALAWGLNAGVLDAATYVPVVARAWKGLADGALQPSGFLRGCQAVGFEPAPSYTGTAPVTAPSATSAGSLHTDEPPFCAGAFLLAASELARLTGPMSTGRPVTATAQQTGNEAARAVDGDMGTRWSAQGFPQQLTVDLGTRQRVSNVQLVTFQDRPYQYRVETSIDGATWTTVVDRTASTEPGTMLDAVTGAPDARWVRLTVTGVADASTTWVAIRELSVHDRYRPRPDLALSRSATATSSTDSGAPSRVTDHAPATWWQSAATPTPSAPQQLTIDLGTPATVDTLRVWSRAGSGPSDVTALVSTDGAVWTTVAELALPSAQGPHVVVLAPVTARLVRLDVTGAHGGGAVRIEDVEVAAP
jgi:rhamnogalacturonyl hydrolase YesR